MNNYRTITTQLGTCRTILVLYRNKTNNFGPKRGIIIYVRTVHNIEMISPLILSRNRPEESLHAKVPPYEDILAGGAGRHRLLLTAGLADQVAL